MELGRNVTLGHYVPGASAVHTMDPRVKIVGWVMIATALFLTGTFTGLAFVALFLLALVGMARLPLRYVLRGLLPMLPFLVVIYLIQILFSGSLYPESKNVIWEWWIFRVTGEGVIEATQVILRVVVLYLSVTILTLVTSLVMLVDGAERLSSPLRRVGVPNQELAMVAAIALRFVPTLIEEAEKLMKAQMARGAQLEQGGFIKKTRARIPIFVPLFLNTLRRAGDLIVAMESRCYRGGKGRTKRRELRMGSRDWLGLALAVSIAVVAVAFRNLGMP